MAFEYDVTRDIDFSPENIGRSAAEKSIASIRPKRAESFTGKVILGPDPASQILFYPIFYSVNADNVQRKRSLWKDKIGEKVAFDSLTLTDDGLLPKGIGSSNFDADGVPHQKTPIIIKGILKNFLHDSFTANKEGKKSTGNASRESYRNVSRVSVSNFIIAPGKKKLNDIIAEVDKGIIVRRFSGNVHPESGEFSGVAKQASYIENGEIKHALKETMISGNTFETLMNTIDIGSETRSTFGRIYTPPILIDNVTIISK
jgi:PmbA protein